MLRNDRAFVLSLSVVFAFASPASALAWGHAGHVLISRAAAAALPASVPAFLHTADALWAIGELGPEADELKGSGTSFDRDEDPGHYLDLADDGSVAGVVPLASLPKDREDYDTALRAAGSDQYESGYLPYSIVDGFEVVRRDFAWWRVDDYGARTATDARERAAFERRRELRERLTIRDIGYWSHFVGDGSQPLHVSIHFDGWPERYPGSKGLHAHFETAYVNEFIDASAVRSRVAAYAPCRSPIEREVEAYLSATNAQVGPLYELFKSGAFAGRTDAGVNFTAERLAAGATELRNLIVAAWMQSEDDRVGYPPVYVRDIEKGVTPLQRRFREG